MTEPEVAGSPFDPPMRAVRKAVTIALEEDCLPLGDLTASLVGETEHAEAAIVARAPGVAAGRLCAIETFRQVDPTIEVEWLAVDGTALAAGAVVARVRGPFRSILTAERTALNFLCHLSGVATATRRVVEAVAIANSTTKVLDTRKTIPGLRALQKAAVRAGGGRNHRGSLSDGVLLKDNHLGSLSITDAVALARDRFPMRMVEVECDHLEQALEAASAGAHVVMLDNMTPDEVGAAVRALRDAGSDVQVEVSGGVTEDSARAFAAAGADLLSLGALTHSAVSLDLGLDLVTARDG